MVEADAPESSFGMTVRGGRIVEGRRAHALQP
jgi:hypothetical protein